MVSSTQEHGDDEEAAVFVIPYDPTRESYFYPGRANDFFNYGPISSEAALCAEMSRLAYVKQVDQLDVYLRRGNFTLVGVVGYSAPGARVLIAKSTDMTRPIVVAAFCGMESEEPTDLFRDSQFRLDKWYAAGKVYEGFRDAVPDVYHLTSFFFTSARLLFTGHGVGGALATLAAALHRPDYLYTFGSPRVGDTEFATTMREVHHARYVNCCDLLTRLPPDTVEYVHVGVLHYIDRHGAIVLSPSEQLIIEDQSEAATEYESKHALFPGTVPVRQLADHAPINYLSAVMSLRRPEYDRPEVLVPGRRSVKPKHERSSKSVASRSATGAIFISYRRQDEPAFAGRLHDKLVARFGKKGVFIDVASIELGRDFIEVVDQWLSECKVVVVIIGKGWLHVKDAHGQPRLDNPSDFVRIEIETALMRNIRVIPVLVEGASVPKGSELPESMRSLSRRNGMDISHARFAAEAGQLVTVLGRILKSD